MITYETDPLVVIANHVQNPNRQPLSFNEKVKRAAIAAGAIVMTGLAAMGIMHYESKDADREAAMEACVSTLTGEEVDLYTGEDGRIHRPAEVFDEITACQEADGDPSEAAERLSLPFEDIPAQGN